MTLLCYLSACQVGQFKAQLLLNADDGVLSAICHGRSYTSLLSVTHDQSRQLSISRRFFEASAYCFDVFFMFGMFLQRHQTVKKRSHHPPFCFKGVVVSTKRLHGTLLLIYSCSKKRNLTVQRGRSSRWYWPLIRKPRYQRRPTSTRNRQFRLHCCENKSEAAASEKREPGELLRITPLGSLQWE